MMALYRKEKINPVSGCLPMLIQIPFFFAIYKMLFVTLEMRQAPFFGWIQDLSAKKFRRGVQASTADSQGRTARVNWRYVFRGPRGRNMFGDCDSFTPKCNAHSFDVYHR